MSERYLPVPVWNNSSAQWEAVDFRHGQKVVTWPDGVDPTRIPLPEYRDRDRVQFVRDETCAREGVVRMVLSRGGSYGPLDDPQRVIQDWYYNPDNILYIITARGHDHRVRAHNILGQFFSPRDRF